ALRHVDALEDDALAGGDGAHHLGLFALVLTGQDNHLVSLVDSNLEHLTSERHDAHEALVAQLAADGPEDAGPAPLLLIVNEHGCVGAKADIAPIRAPLLS